MTARTGPGGRAARLRPSCAEALVRLLTRSGLSDREIACAVRHVEATGVATSAEAFALAMARVRAPGGQPAWQHDLDF